jgi:DNA invertase Pin-like site-specific DNA recombinase
MEAPAVSYLRCSGESQIQGDTWERQNAIIAKYASANNIEVAKEFRDEGVTGKMELEGRTGLSACIEYVRENGIKLVLIEDSTRLARDMIVAEVVIREFQKIGVRVIAASGGIDLTEGDDSNPTAKLIRQILAAVSEFERCCITLKLRGARQRKRIKDGIAKGYSEDDAAKFGKCEGRISFGLKPGESTILSEMQTARRHGMSYDAIAAMLNATNTPTRYGKSWRSSTIAKILKRDSHL